MAGCARNGSCKLLSECCARCHEGLTRGSCCPLPLRPRRSGSGVPPKKLSRRVCCQAGQTHACVNVSGAGRERNFGREHGLAFPCVRGRGGDPPGRPLVPQPPLIRQRHFVITLRSAHPHAGSARYNACKNAIDYVADKCGIPLRTSSHICIGTSTSSFS